MYLSSPFLSQSCFRFSEKKLFGKYFLDELLEGKKNVFNQLEMSLFSKSWLFDCQ